MGGEREILRIARTSMNPIPNEPLDIRIVLLADQRMQELSTAIKGHKIEFRMHILTVGYAALTDWKYDLMRKSEEIEYTWRIWALVGIGFLVITFVLNQKFQYLE